MSYMFAVAKFTTATILSPTCKNGFPGNNNVLTAPDCCSMCLCITL